MSQNLWDKADENWLAKMKNVDYKFTMTDVFYETLQKKDSELCMSTV